MTAVGPEPPQRPVLSRRHQTHRFLGRLHEVMDSVDTTRAWTLHPAELAESLREAYAAQARLAELTLGLVAQAELAGLAAHHGYPSLAAWLREQVRLAPGEAKKQIRLAQALGEHPLTREALADGSFPAASAAVITDALDALPSDLDADLVERAEQHLAGEGHAHDTQALRRIAARLDEVLDPDGAEARLGAQLARAEARAARQAVLNLWHDETTATTHGTFRLPLLSGMKLQRMIESLLNPGRPDPMARTDVETGVKLAPEELRGHALIELIHRIPAGKLPRTGGCDPTVVITMELDTLLGGLRAAHLDTGHAISPGAARRLAAQCGVIPAVLGASGEVLDLGRKARFFTKKQRLAMTIQQGGVCAVDGCGRPATWGDAHHLKQWQSGGRTDLQDGVLVCRAHHTYADHSDYRVERLRPGRIRIHRRC
jgi:hypothetical protein